MLIANGYGPLFLIATSREDQVGIATIQEILQRLTPQAFDEHERSFLQAMYRDGDFANYKPGKRGNSIAGIFMMFFTEHNQCPPDELMQQENYYADDMTLRAANIARALIAGDNAALERAIDEAEEHQLIVHAAHMRIVLAKRTGDRSHLERARSVLERLEDRLFLRKLQEVETLLQTQ